MNPTVLVPLDGTLQARVALPVARGLARIEGATLRILHVSDPRKSPAELPPILGLSPEEVEGAVLETASGPPGRAILEAARGRNTWLVMCTHTAPGHPKMLIGGTVAEVLRRARCPVLLVPPARGLAPWNLEEVLVPFDGSPSTGAALCPAAELATRANATLFVLHVATAEPHRSQPGTLAAPRYLDQPQHELPAWTHELLERLACLCKLPGGAKPRLYLSRGDAGTEIVRFAADHDVDVIAVAWRGRLEPDRAHVARAILSQSSVPMLVLRIFD